MRIGFALRLISLSFAHIDYVSCSRQFERTRKSVSIASHNLQLYNMIKLPRDNVGNMYRLPGRPPRALSMFI